tara:strand:- start:149 stop:385 length:237 start_codon:yes stop_codon:yes gene_type:complete
MTVSRSDAETSTEQTSRQESHIQTSNNKDTQQTTQAKETVEFKKNFSTANYEELPAETYGERPPLEYLTGLKTCQHPD